MTPTSALAEAVATDPERIWLQPACCVDPNSGRLWCEDSVWPDADDCNVIGVEYVRADRAAAAQEREKIVAFLEKLSRDYGPIRGQLLQAAASDIHRGDHL
jgi:hypothetical protein